MQLPPVQATGTTAGPQPSGGAATPTAGSLPAPQQQAFLASPLPALRVPARPAPQPAQPVPGPGVGASLLLLAGPHDTLRSLYREVYHGMRPPAFETVAALNPRMFRPGTRLIFPAPPDGWPRPRRPRR